MRILFKLLIAALAVAILGAAWVRLAPTAPAAWHVDPATVTPPATPNFVLIRGDGAPHFDQTPAELATAFNRAALATSRTRLLAGSDGRMTYVTRSKWLGFPDYTSVAITADTTGARLAIFARSRFGKYDFGVNEARVMAWLSALGR